MTNNNTEPMVSNVSDSSPNIVITKTAQKTTTFGNEKILIETTITNNTDVEIMDLDIYDVIGDGATYSEGSFMIGSESFGDFDPTFGFTYHGPITPSGGIATYSYEIAVEESPSVENIVIDTFVALEFDGEYIDLPVDELNIAVLKNKLTLTKTTDKTISINGEILTYFVNIENSGTLDNTNLFFKDVLPTNVEFVEQSVKVDGIATLDANPTDGFSIGNLASGKNKTIEFSVMVKG